MAEVGDIHTEMSRERRNMVYLALHDAFEVNLPRLSTLGGTDYSIMAYM